jgi:GTP cyclohydrolase I
VAWLDEMRCRADEEVTYKSFASPCDDLIIEHDIPFSSLCEHHLLPYFGHAQIGYLPKGRVLGASKLARIVRKLSAGLTIQEDLTHDIARVLHKAAHTDSVAVTTRAMHTCMTIRGVQANGTTLSYSSMWGTFRDSPALRAEFLELTKR